MRTILASIRVALLACIPVLIGATGSHAQQNLPRFSLKSGENAVLREYYYVVNCRSIMIGQPTVEVLEGLDDLTVAVKEGMILPRSQNCPKEVLGGTVIATAKQIDEHKEGKLTIRLKFNTKQGERQSSNTYLISLFP
jgi:hypothetical protein